MRAPKSWIDELLSCLVVLALGSFSCEEYGQRIYTARLYRVGARCLEPYTPIGVVQAGELHANCPAQCLSLDGELYVSTVCPPLPARANAAVLPEEVTACGLALAAHELQVTCGASDAGLDGGQNADALESSAGP